MTGISHHQKQRHQDNVHGMSGLHMVACLWHHWFSGIVCLWLGLWMKHGAQANATHTLIKRNPVNQLTYLSKIFLQTRF